MDTPPTRRLPDRRRTRWWLALSLPAAALGMVAAAAGAFVDGAYEGMTDEWAQQTYAQDLADLVVAFPAVLALGWAARQGSTRALLGWLGVVTALFYTYVIYAFHVPFGHLYLANVLLLGAFGWAFAGAVRAIDFEHVARRFDDAAPIRSTGLVLAGIGVAFLALWMLEDLPATIAGEPPDTLGEVGLLVNPIHVLDTAFLLPACIVAGVGVMRRRAWGCVFAPVLLVTLATISVGIVMIMAIAIAEGEEQVLPVAIVMAIIGTAQLALAVRFLRHLRPEPDTERHGGAT